MPRTHPPHRPRRRTVRGFSLIEILIVILILSFGLLGIAGLQATTAKYKINSWARSAASVQFSDLADRIRANPRGAGVTIGTVPVVANGYALADDWATQQAAALAIAQNCFTANCTEAQRAAFDMLSWRNNVRRMFPQGAGLVNVTLAGGGTNFTIANVNATIAWFDRQFTQLDGSLDTSAVCPADPVALAALPAAQRASCCPAVLAAPAGVRCTNVSFLP